MRVALSVAGGVCRYLVAAQLVCKAKTEERRDKWHNNNKHIKRILCNEEYQYSDPITDFHKAVYVDYDFNRAQVRRHA